MLKTAPRIKKIEDFIRNRQWILIIWGLIWAFFFVIPIFFVKETGGANWYKAQKLDVALELFMNTGEFDNAHLGHSLGWIYFPFIMRIFHLNADMMFMGFQSFLGMVVITAYPILIYRLYHSSVLAFVTPFFVHFIAGDKLYIEGNEEFYSIMWAVIMAMPFLIRLIKREGKMIPNVIAVSVVMAVSNILRFHSGLPVLFVTVLILLIRFFRERYKTVILLVCLFCILGTYNLLARTIPNFIASAWADEGTLGYNSSPWHSILIGFGYIENDYGLAYDDGTAMELIARRYPGVEYQSDEYYKRCREVAINIIIHDPKFVAKVEFIKFYESLCAEGNYLLSRFGTLFLGILGSIVLIYKKCFIQYLKENRWTLILCAAFCILAMYSGIAAIPKTSMYIYSAIGCVSIFLMYWLLTIVNMLFNRTEEIK